MNECITINLLQVQGPVEDAGQQYDQLMNDFLERNKKVAARCNGDDFFFRRVFLCFVFSLLCFACFQRVLLFGCETDSHVHIPLGVFVCVIIVPCVQINSSLL